MTSLWQHAMEINIDMLKVHVQWYIMGLDWTSLTSLYYTHWMPWNISHLMTASEPMQWLRGSILDQLGSALANLTTISIYEVRQRRGSPHQLLTWSLEGGLQLSWWPAPAGPPPDHCSQCACQHTLLQSNATGTHTHHVCTISSCNRDQDYTL